MILIENIKRLEAEEQFMFAKAICAPHYKNEDARQYWHQLKRQAFPETMNAEPVELKPEELVRIING